VWSIVWFLVDADVDTKLSGKSDIGEGGTTQKVTSLFFLLKSE
jgi:hypothetical protein